MAIFKLEKTSLKNIKIKPFKLESELQAVIETNLDEVFGLELVKSEFSLDNLRVDTLAFDNESKSFVIIEYKKDKNFTVIDQGFSYLALLLNKKSDFILEYNETMGKSLRKDDIDWSQSKVYFVSPEFTKYQRQAINFRDLPIILFEATRFENETLLINELKSFDARESISAVGGQNEIVKNVSKEVKVYTEEKHFQGKSEDIANLYNEIKERVVNLGLIKTEPKSVYIGFKAKSNFFDVEIQNSQIKSWINLRKGELDDPRRLARDVSNTGHHGNGDYEINIKQDTDLDYLMTLIKQSYKKHE